MTLAKSGRARPISTPIFRRNDVSAEATQQMADGFAEQVPMKRLGQPEEVAKGVAFIASDDASYITGVGSTRRRHGETVNAMG